MSERRRRFEGASREAELRVAHAADQSVPGRRLLVVGDDAAVLTTVISMLTASAWRVLTAETFELALALLSQQDFDAFLVDLDLRSHRSGLDLLRDMPQRNRRKPFIVCTGKGTQERCRHAFLAGVSDFVNKPLAHEVLLSALNATPTDASQTEMEAADRNEAEPGWRRVNTAIQSIERRFRELNLTRNAIAEDSSSNADYLGRLFNRHLGCTPIDYLHEIRVAEAARLLEHTRLSIYEIARACGYHNTGELHGHFRRRHGCPPTAYRANLDRA